MKQLRGSLGLWEQLRFLSKEGLDLGEVWQVGVGEWRSGSIQGPALDGGSVGAREEGDQLRCGPLAGGRVKTWKRRWFILTDSCLYYFEFTTVSLCLPLPLPLPSSGLR